MKFKTLLIWCSVFNFITLLLHLSAFYAPMSLVRWGCKIDSPLWACIFNNKSTVNFFNLEYPAWVPIIVVILIQLVIHYHYFKPKKPYLMYEPLPRINNSNGFSLIEVMMCIAILGILATIGYGNFDISKYRQRAAARDLYSTIQYSKSLAVKTNRTVYLGINENQCDIWVDNKLYKSTPVTPGIKVISDDIEPGEIGATESPRFIPPDVQEQITIQCNSQLSESCQPYIDWVNSFKGVEYDHVTIFNSRSMVNIGYGTYYVVGSKSKIPVVLSIAGAVSTRPPVNI